MDCRDHLAACSSATLDLEPVPIFTLLFALENCSSIPRKSQPCPFLSPSPWERALDCVCNNVTCMAIGKTKANNSL